MTLRLLYVCTGNVCRSPMAELLLRSWAAPDADLEVGSAGVAALEGEAMDGSSAAALRQLGVDPDAHRARQFEARMAASADLVLTAETAHRDFVMTELPAAFRRTFTMKEFARVAPHVTAALDDDPRRTIALIADARAAAGAVSGDEDDMPDPYRGPIEKARSIAQQITDTVHWTMGALDLWPDEHLISPPTVDVPPPARRGQPRRRPRPLRR